MRQTASQRSPVALRRSSIGGWLVEWRLWMALAAALLLWSLAYQWPATQRIDFGGNLETYRRYDDEPFLAPRSFNAPEPAPASGDDRDWWQLGQAPYRWTRADSIVMLPGLGGGAWLAAFRAAGQPGGRVTSRWSDGRTALDVPLAPEPRIYRWLTRPDAAGDLALRFVTPPLAAPGDPRSLGFVAYRLAVTPVAGPRLPAGRTLALLAATLALAYGLAWALGAPRRWGLAGALGLALAATWLLAADRATLAAWAPGLLGVALGGWGLALVLAWLPWLATERPTAHRSLAIALVVLAFTVRLGGMLHPVTRFSDLGLNANNLLEFSLGSVFFTEQLPARAGGGPAPYPPGQYIVEAPAQLPLAPGDDSRRMVVIVTGALLDSLALLGIWAVLRAATGDATVAAFGAALYLLPVPALRSLSVGEFANVAGQALAFPALALLAVAGARLRERRMFVTALALLAMALLGHSGVALSLGLLLGGLAAAWLLSRAQRRAAPALILAIALAAGFAALGYYSAFLHLLGAAPEALPGAAGGPARLWQALASAVGGARPLLSPLAVTLGAAGLVLLRPRGNAPAAQRALWLLLLAWWGGALLSLGALLVRGQTVRWELFLYPALCLGGGPALAWLWRRGPAGRIAAAAALAVLLAGGAAYWAAQLADYLH